MTGAFDSDFFDSDWFDTDESGLTGLIPRGSVAGIAVPGRPAAAMAVPSFNRTTTIVVPDRPTGAVT